MAIANPDDSVIHKQDGVRLLRLCDGVFLVKPRPEMLWVVFCLVFATSLSALAVPVAWCMAKLSTPVELAFVGLMLAYCVLVPVGLLFLAYVKMFPRRLVIDLNHQTCAFRRFVGFSTVISIDEVVSVDMDSKYVTSKWSGWIDSIHLKMRNGRRHSVFYYATRRSKYLPGKIEKLRPLASLLAELINRPLHVEQEDYRRR